MIGDHISIEGAREHNLKNITAAIPRNKLTVITGLSGSGKSSLAFDTLYAEGQRRYVESLSAYARQFLERLRKPDVDRITGLSPAIAIEQRTAGSNPRSIVATSTEIHDYLRLLFAHAGVPHCPKCGRPVTCHDSESITGLLAALPPETKLSVLAPLGPAEVSEALAEARKDGFVRVRLDGEIMDLDAIPRARLKGRRAIDIVVDRIAIGKCERSRLADSVETALRRGGGAMTAMIETPGCAGREERFSERNACAECRVEFEILRPGHFSFNNPYGACPVCSGLGARMIFDETLIVPDPELSLDRGAIRAWRRGGRRLVIYYNRLLRAVAAHFGFDMETPWRALPAEARRMLMRGSGAERIAVTYRRGGVQRSIERPFEGVIPNLERRMEETRSEDVKKSLRRYMSRGDCPGCRGARHRPEVLSCLVAGKSIADVCRMPVRDAFDFFGGLRLDARRAEIAGEVIDEIKRRLKFLLDVGLGYLALDRESATLSGGEAQRIRLATQIGCGLTGVLYVLDEPSIGLHHRDNQRLIQTLFKLRDAGNTVVVVEHDEDTIRQADHVIDLGPGAGRDGGRIVYGGPPCGIAGCEESLTGAYLKGARAIPVPAKRVKPGRDRLVIVGAAENNLKNITVEIPLGLFVCVTGVSGSGKSTLVDFILRRALLKHLKLSSETPGRHSRALGLDLVDKLVTIDQSPIGKTPRSNPATYTGVFDLIRDLFAQAPLSKARGYGPGRYSFNVKGGRCERCGGAGAIRIEMHFLPDVYVTCEQCRGKRYNSETLDVKFAGRNISETLDLTVDEAMNVFNRIPALERKLKTMSEVGLGYVQLGQSAVTLSGGEAQRMKLSAELGRKATGRTLYLLDEPTTGLHFADIGKLLNVLVRLRDLGNTVLVIEHNLEVIKTADHIIDLGPEGGEYGGSVVATGTPEQVAREPRSHTGALLAGALAARSGQTGE